MSKQKKSIGIQLDFKGIQFKPAYIPQLMADLASQGISTLLVEYEDVFPFTGLDVAADKPRTWSPRTLKRFLNEAATHGIEIIPLQQCLGHLEYVFRWDRYQHLAEDPAYPSTVKLSSPEARTLVIEMLRQVMDAHPGSRYVHVGMDEAKKLGASTGRDALEVFLEWLDELCSVVEAHGKTPIVWTDMLQDHFKAGALEKYRQRVVFMPWDYATQSERTAQGRIGGGQRISRYWRDHPEDRSGPPVGSGTRYVEDLPPRERKTIKPYYDGRHFTAMFQADLFTQMGYRVIGAAAIRASSHGPLYPDFGALRANIQTWAAAITRTDQLGLIGTSWARGNTFCPPNFPIDMTWPNIVDLSRAMGAKPKPFWPGVPARAIDRLVQGLGRCKVDWTLEAELAQEMATLAPAITAHRYEWESLRLMALVRALHRRVAYVLSEVDYFRPAARPIAAEWQRRIDDQAAVRKDLAALKKTVRKHFAQRYHGQAFDEWLRDLFDGFNDRLNACTRTCKEKKAIAHQTYAH